MKKKSGYKGVSWDEQRRAWRAVFSDPWTDLGYYVTEIQAAMAFDIEAKKHGYTPAKLNFPRGLDAEGKPL